MNIKIKSSNLPNLITSVRLIAAVLIAFSCFLASDGGANNFLTLFIIAGVSDMLDGYVARKYHWCTEFGARLDSISDLTLYLAVLLFLIVHFSQAVMDCRIFILLGFSIQIAHLVLAFRRFGQFPAYHTTLSRICAYFVFFGVIVFLSTHSSPIIAALAIAWTVCSIEGMIITIVLKRRLNNLSGIGAALAAN